MRRPTLGEAGIGYVQMLILASVLALGGLVAVRLLAGAVSSRTECAGRQIISLDGAAAPCGEGQETTPPAAPSVAEGRPPNRAGVAAPASDRPGAPPGRPRDRAPAAGRPRDGGREVSRVGNRKGLPGRAPNQAPVLFLVGDRDDDQDDGQGDGSGNGSDFDAGDLISPTDVLRPERRDDCLVGGGLGPVSAGGPLVQPEFVPGGGPRVSCEEERPPERPIPLIPELDGRNRANAPPARGTKRLNDACSNDSECARGHCRNVKGRDVCVDCSRSAFNQVQAQLNNFCKGPPLSCKTIPPNLPSNVELSLIDERIELTTRCINARTRRENQCFGGGDKEHLFQISRTAAIRTLCNCLRAALGNPTFGEAERASRAKSCRQVQGI